MSPVRIAIFASGSGSNAQALVEKTRTLSVDKIKIEFILCDQPQAGVLKRAEALTVPSYLVKRTKDKAADEKKMIRLIDEHKIDWILLAGYMRLLSADFLKELADRHFGHAQTVNIHPSLLPAFPGSGALQKAFAEKVVQTGVTLHLVDEGMDTGAILTQVPLPLNFSESYEVLEQRVHQLEHQVYGDFLAKLVRQEVATIPYTRSIHA